MSRPSCRQGWEALAGDPLPEILGAGPGLRWRALVDLVKRPADSPAVSRARSMVNATRPVSDLLADLLPDGQWSTGASTWDSFAGPGWRLVIAVQLGADPGDPRLQAACRRLLAEDQGAGGFQMPAGGQSSPLTSARFLAALAALGFLAEPRVVEAAAWLEECDWDLGGEDAIVTATAILAVGSPLKIARRGLFDRSKERVFDTLASDTLPSKLHLTWPNLVRTDLAEMLGALARAGVAYDPRMKSALVLLQELQDERGLWSVADGPELRQSKLPVPLGPEDCDGWVSLAGALAMLSFASTAKLPRVFPQPPGKG